MGRTRREEGRRQVGRQPSQTAWPIVNLPSQCPATLAAAAAPAPAAPAAAGSPSTNCRIACATPCWSLVATCGRHPGRSARWRPRTGPPCARAHTTCSGARAARHPPRRLQPPGRPGPRCPWPRPARTSAASPRRSPHRPWPSRRPGPPAGAKAGGGKAGTCSARSYCARRGRPARCPAPLGLCLPGSLPSPSSPRLHSSVPPPPQQPPPAHTAMAQPGPRLQVVQQPLEARALGGAQRQHLQHARQRGGQRRPARQQLLSQRPDLVDPARGVGSGLGVRVRGAGGGGGGGGGGGTGRRDGASCHRPLPPPTATAQRAAGRAPLQRPPHLGCGAMKMSFWIAVSPTMLRSVPTASGVGSL
jgi:hypothetical protein